MVTQGRLTFTESEVKDLRVLCTTPCLHVLDGVSLTVRKIYKQVKKRGGKMKILTSDASKTVLKDEDLYPDLIFCSSWDFPYDLKDNYTLTGMLNNRIKAEILAFNPTVYHFTSPDPIAFSVSEWTRKNQWPLIATWHSNIPDYFDHVGAFQKTFIKPLSQFLFNTLYSYALYTYVPQIDLARRLESEGYKNLRVWGRGVDIEAYNPSKRSENFRRELGIKSDQTVILWVSRCVQEKRPDVFIEVMKRLNLKYPGKVVGIIVGRGDRFAEMSEIPNVIGMGWKDKAELSIIYASSDLLLFPSAVETFGNVTLEGMSSGIPVLGDAGCSSHLISNGVNGFVCSQTIVDGKDIYLQYFEAAEKLIKSPQLRLQMGQNGRKLAVSKYEINQVMDEFVAHYCEATELGRLNLVPKMKFNMSQRLVRYCYEFLDKAGKHFVRGLGFLAFNMPNADRLVFVSGVVGLTGLIGIVNYARNNINLKSG